MAQIHLHPQATCSKHSMYMLKHIQIVDVDYFVFFWERRSGLMPAHLFWKLPVVLVVLQKAHLAML